jgi:hypothetical protein
MWYLPYIFDSGIQDCWVVGSPEQKNSVTKLVKVSGATVYVSALQPTEGYDRLRQSPKAFGRFGHTNRSD